MVNSIDYVVNLVDMDETYNPMIYEELPAIYQEQLDFMAGIIFDPTFGKLCITGPKDSGKTFLLHQFVANIDRYLDKLGKSKMVFIRISAAEIRKLEMSNVNPDTFVSQICDQFDCDFREICFVGSDETAIEAIYRVFGKCRAIFEIDFEKSERAGKIVTQSYPHIDATQIKLKKSELIQLLDESVIKEIHEIFKVQIDKKTVSAFINYAIRNMPELILNEDPENKESKPKRDPMLVPPAGIWAKAMRRLGSIVALSESPEIRKGDEIVMGKVISTTFKEFYSSFESFTDEDEDEESLGLPREIREMLGINVPSGSSDPQEKEELEFSDIDELIEDIKKEIIGQDEAVEGIVDGLVVPAAGLNDKQKPIRSYLLLGPTGTGKTKTALTLAEKAFDKEMNIVRIDMSEFAEAHESSKLIGSPPGYVGHESGGMLTNAVREHPNSLVLLDEIEKAHPRVWDSFLQVLDAGRLTDSDGDVVDFTSTIVVMTSNIGVKELGAKKVGYAKRSEAAEKDARFEDSKKIMLRALEDNGFRTEFINRIDEVVVFRELTLETSRAIVQKEINSVSDKMSDNGFILNDIHDGVIDAILQLSDVSKFGAREVQRVVYKNVAMPIAKKMINVIKQDKLDIMGDKTPSKIAIVAQNGKKVDLKSVIGVPSDIQNDDIQSNEKEPKKKNRKIETIDDLVALESDESDDCIINLSLDSDNKIVVS